MEGNWPLIRFALNLNSGVAPYLKFRVWWFRKSCDYPIRTKIWQLIIFTFPLKPWINSLEYSGDVSEGHVIFHTTASLPFQFGM
jgi:hypothetical protein